MADTKQSSGSGSGGAAAKEVPASEHGGSTLSITNVLLMREAESRGWKTRILNLKQDMCLIYPPAPESEILIRRATTELTTALGAVIAHDKHMTYTMAEHAGVPYPKSLLFKDSVDGWKAAIAFVAEHKHCVVKPTDRAHGDGVSTEVRDENSLRTAISFAQKQSSNIVIQRWVSGVDFRIVVLNNKVIAAARRRPAFVIGDGKHTISQLINIKNTHPWRGAGHSSPLTLIDPTEVDAYLRSTNLPHVNAMAIGSDTTPPPQLDMKSVLKAGADVELLGTANLSRGGEAIDVTDEMHPATKALAVRIAAACQLGLVGVDFRCSENVSAPPEESHPSLLEINLTPGLRMHHYPGVGTARNVAGQVLDEILRRRRVWAIGNSLANSAQSAAAAATTTAATPTTPSPALSSSSHANTPAAPAAAATASK